LRLQYALPDIKPLSMVQAHVTPPEAAQVLSLFFILFYFIQDVSSARDIAESRPVLSLLALVVQRDKY